MILEWISLRLFPDYLVPQVLGIQRQQVCVELKHLGSSGIFLVLGGLFCNDGLVVEGLVLVAKFWGWCAAKAAASLVFLEVFSFSEGFFSGSFSEAFSFSEDIFADSFPEAFLESFSPSLVGAVRRARAAFACFATSCCST